MLIGVAVGLEVGLDGDTPGVAVTDAGVGVNVGGISATGVGVAVNEAGVGTVVGIISTTGVELTAGGSGVGSHPVNTVACISITDKTSRLIIISSESFRQFQQAKQRARLGGVERTATRNRGNFETLGRFIGVAVYGHNGQ
ncbi:MAG: hypothetical protein HYR94_19495 [Chloroflexi bacterium]|nr:hypothetical protein [Chloroflexota bacterium]